MTIRSIPPSSSHLAERPVPAPPPTIGRPSRTMAWNCSRRCRRGMAGMRLPSDYGSEMQRSRLGEGSIVDMARQADDTPPFGLLHRLLDPREQGGVRLRIGGRLARGHEG